MIVKQMAAAVVMMSTTDRRAEVHGRQDK